MFSWDGTVACEDESEREVMSMQHLCAHDSDQLTHSVRAVIALRAFLLLQLSHLSVLNSCMILLIMDNDFAHNFVAMRWGGAVLSRAQR